MEFAVSASPRWMYFFSISQVLGESSFLHVSDPERYSTWLDEFVQLKTIDSGVQLKTIFFQQEPPSDAHVDLVMFPGFSLN